MWRPLTQRHRQNGSNNSGDNKSGDNNSGDNNSGDNNSVTSGGSKSTSCSSLRRRDGSGTQQVQSIIGSDCT